MEKVLLEVSVNDIQTDCVITLSESVTTDENGERVWHDKEKNIVAAKKYAYKIDMFVKEKDGQYKKINISSNSIKKIHEEILRIESIDATIELD